MEDRPITLANLNAAAKSGASGSLLAGASGSSAYMKFLEEKAGFIPELGIPSDFFGRKIIIWDMDEPPFKSFYTVYFNNMPEKEKYDTIKNLFGGLNMETLDQGDEIASICVDGKEILFGNFVLYLARDYTEMCPLAKKGTFWDFESAWPKNNFLSDGSRNAYAIDVKRLYTPKEVIGLLRKNTVNFHQEDYTNVQISRGVDIIYGNEYNKEGVAGYDDTYEFNLFRVIDSESYPSESDLEEMMMYYLACDRLDLHENATAGNFIYYDGRSCKIYRTYD